MERLDSCSSRSLKHSNSPVYYEKKRFSFEEILNLNEELKLSEKSIVFNVYILLLCSPTQLNIEIFSNLGVLA